MSDQSTLRTCPLCGSGQRAEARFCDQCGAALSSAGLKTQRLSTGDLPSGPAHPLGAGLLYAMRRLLDRGGEPEADRPAQPPLAERPWGGGAPEGAVLAGEWGEAGDYMLIVHRALRGVSEHGDACVALEVGYRSRASGPLRVSISQWTLCDVNGYRYEAELGSALLLGERQRALPDDQIEPGGAVRGWVGFPCPLDAPITHARFRVNYARGERFAFALPPPEYRHRSRQ